MIRSNSRKWILAIMMITFTGVVLSIQTMPAGLLNARIFEWKNMLATPDTLVVDTNEYAPKINAVEQIEQAPSPRFLKGHGLLPNVLWMSPRYFGGLGQPGISQKKAIDDSRAIMLSLAQRMNYYLILPGNTYGIKGYNDTNTFAGAYIDLANRHPELPASVITFWAQIKPKVCGYNYDLPAIFRTDFPDDHYVRWDGKKRFSPAAPDDSLIMDGKVLRCYLEELCRNLTRPVQLINENGEVFKLFGKKMLEKDPYAQKDKSNRNINDWDVYEATRRLEKEMIVQQQFLTLPCLKNTVYTQYAIDGHITYRHRYQQVRQINSKINGQYYSTPDFYPRWPSNWKYWKGAWHGFKWIADCRAVEIAAGDLLYSPFVSAGWDINESRNIRPAQWLGLLKALGVTGAEFYYTGFFSLKAPFPKPENYAWQALMPSYAQAVTSRYEAILRNGILLGGPSYNFSKKEDELIVVRKAKDENIYIISGTIQPSNNHKESSPLERETSISLDGKKFTFMIRRQGSTYVLDLQNDSPIFYQLDTWHEYAHPSRWTHDTHRYEAEVPDNIKNKPQIKTDVRSANNFTTFTSYISLSKDDVATYHLSIVKKHPKCFVFARMRGHGNISLMNFKSTTVSTNDWRWMKIGTLGSATNVDVTINGSNIDIDKFVFSLKDQTPTE